MTIQVNSEELTELLGESLEAKLVPMIHGSPGVGKSDIARAVARKYKLKLIDMRLSQSDPVDLSGMPRVSGDKASFIPMDLFPIEGDAVPEGYNGWLLFLDEINSAPLAVQAAAFKLVLDKMVGQHHLHPNVAIIAAGNLSTDKGIVNRLSTPMQSRLVHFELKVDHKAWIKWAQSADVDFRIISFIGFKPEALFTFKPDHNDFTFGCPRTHEFMSNIVKKYPEDIPSRIIPLMSGTVGEALAREFYAYAKIFKTLLTIPKIMSDPSGVEVPTEPSVQYALAGSIGQHLNKDNTETLLIFIERMNIEMQILCIQGARALDTKNELYKIPALQDWMTRYAKDLFL